jgi:beta-lactamase regulating signal transducer with metallopeptidase domain/Tol biopolymer transport system component
MEAILSSIQPFFNWLLQATLSGSVVIVLILLAQKVLGGKLGPRWSHALWLLLLIRLMLPGTLPGQIDLPGLFLSSDQQIEQKQPSEAVKEQAASQISEESLTISGQIKDPVVGRQEPTTPKPGMIANLQNQHKPWLVSFHRVLPFIWVAGAVVIGLYILMSNFFLWWIVKRERPLLDQKILEIFEECKELIGVQIIVGLIPSAQIKSPALFGFVRPRLLLPKEMLEVASQKEMRYIFLHELAHLKRRDIYLGWLTSFLQILHWFNPLVWFAFYRMRADRELSCDAFVLSRAGKEESQEYGQAILGLLRRFSRSQPLPAMAAILENKSQLKRRITMIAQFKKDSYQWSPLAVFLILAICFVSFSFAAGRWDQKTFLPKSEPTISFRRVETGPISDLSGPPALDGRYICDYDERGIGSPMTSMHLVIRDLISGDVRQLVEVSREGNSYPIISPESEHVAYLDRQELKMIKTDGTEHRVIFRFQEDERFNIRTWAPDGKQILGVFYKGDENAVVMQLVGFSIEDNSMQVIHTFDTSWGSWRSRMVISPDGRFIAYDREQEQDSDARDIYILDIEHKRTECVVQHVANDKLLGWTPDNNYIFFASNRKKGLSGYFAISATCNAYLLPVAQGKPQGVPELVKRDIPSKIRPKGFTRDGSYYYAVEFDTMEAVVADIDMQNGKLLSKPQAVGQTGTDISPAWSPDGNYLAYCVHQSDESGIIRIRNIESGQERDIDPALPPFFSLRWSPDGNFFLVSILESSYNQNFPQYIYRINASTGERVALVRSDSSTLGAAQLSRDGRTLYYVDQDPESSKASIMTRDMESGREEALFSLEGVRYSNFITFALSPDGKQLAIASLIIDRSKGEAERRILTIPAGGDEPRELLRTESKRAQRPSIAWTPDGQSLLFADSVPQRGGALFLIPAGGGQARLLCRPQTMMYGVLLNALDVHPDGQHVAFDCYEYRHEVWAMENFLPITSASKEK